MSRAKASTPTPTTTEEDPFSRAMKFARRSHRAMGNALDEIEKAARRGKGPADSATKERPAGG